MAVVVVVMMMGVCVCNEGTRLIRACYYTGWDTLCSSP